MLGKRENVAPRRNKKSTPLDFRTELIELGMEKTPVRENGRRVLRPLLYIIFQGIWNDAMRDDRRMQKLVSKFLRHWGIALRRKRLEEAHTLKPFYYGEEQERYWQEFERACAELKKTGALSG